MAKLKELAKIVRSKNAGALLFTLDILFEDEEVFERVKSSNVLDAELISKLFRIRLEDIELSEYPKAYAFKITFPRPVISGDPSDTDVYGAQQSAPLLDIEI